MFSPIESSKSRKVLSVNTSDVGGGAERIAWTLFKELQSRDWDSWLIVGDKTTDDDRVVPFFLSSYIDYREYRSRWQHQRLRMRKWWDHFWGHQDYLFPYSHRLLDITRSRPDIVHFHNLHGGYFDLQAAANISTQLPTFVTLEDCWWFTGHCAYPLECQRWRSGCGACPMLDVPPEPKRRDGTRHNWRTKKKIFEQSQFFVAAPSGWILKQANESMFRPAIKESRIIPHGVDIGRFVPAPSNDIRLQIGIPRDSFVAAFTAKNAVSNPFKDYQTIVQSLRLVADESDSPIHLLAIGEQAPQERFGQLIVHHLDFLRSSDDLANVYRAADVYLHAAHQEVFGIVIAEAMACGLPIVATAVGGIPELFDDGVQGYLVGKAKPAEMAKAINRLMRDREMQRRMSHSARKRAVEHFDQRVMTDRYQSWFEEARDVKQNDLSTKVA